MQPSTYIWFNGRLVPWHEATVHVLTHALHYGSSAFEGLRAYETPAGPAVLCLDEHLERLYASCKIFRLDVPHPRAVLRDAVLETIAANAHGACYVRPLVFRGAGGFSLDARRYPVEVAIVTIEWGAYLGSEALERGVDVGVSSWRRVAPGTLPAMGKIGGHYVNSQLVVMEAAQHGYAEGIALDVHGHLSEGSGENLFVVHEGRLLTPPLASSILGGVTRRIVLRLAADLGVEVREEPLPRELLYVADEAFFTGTAAEVTPIRSVDGLPVGAGEPGPITRALQAEFFGIVRGERPDRHGWLTPVRGRTEVTA